MTPEIKYERIGKFIYSASRFGADISAVHSWMADDLVVARPNINDAVAQHDLYTAFFDKYVRDDDFQENHGRFVESIKNRSV